MCGIVGVISTYNSPVAIQMFNHMLQVDVVRGKDGTGVFSVTSKKKCAFVKTANLPQHLLTSKEYAAMVGTHKDPKSSMLIGHNRWATVGDKTGKEAHPFKHGHITLIHNGTIRDTSALIDCKKEYSTDSEYICKSICDLGVEETWSRLNGPAALVWWDSKKKTLNILRNKERPLYWKHNLSRTQMYIASEPWMITSGALRNNVQLEDDTYYPAEDKHYVVGFQKKKKIKHIVIASTELTPFKPEPIFWLDRPKGRPWDKPERAVRFKWMSQEQFTTDYWFCCQCGNALFHDYVSSVIVDDSNALCSECADMCQEWNASLAGPHAILGVPSNTIN